MPSPGSLAASTPSGEDALPACSNRESAGSSFHVRQGTDTINSKPFQSGLGHRSLQNCLRLDYAFDHTLSTYMDKQQNIVQSSEVLLS